MVFCFRAIAISLIFTAVASSAALSQPLTIDLKKLGKLSEQSIPTTTSVVQFYGVSRGSITEFGDVFVSLPYGAKVSIKVKSLKGSIPLALESNTGWRTLSMKTYQGKNRKTLEIIKPKPTNQSLPPPPTLQGRSTEPSCDKLVAQGWGLLIAEYVAMPGMPSREDFCALVLGEIGDTQNPNADGSVNFDDGSVLQPGGSTDDLYNSIDQGPADSQYIESPDFTGPDYGIAAAKFLVQKDTCSLKRNSKTLIVAEVDLSGVDRSAYGNSFDVQVRLSSADYEGKMAASIKPVSDGKYAPQPLLLMANLGGFGSQGQWIDVVQWSKKGPKTIKRLEVKDYAFWRGLSLIRVPIGGILNGGQASFEYTNGSRIYSVCFSLTRTRQKRNGYY